VVILGMWHGGPSPPHSARTKRCAVHGACGLLTGVLYVVALGGGIPDSEVMFSPQKDSRMPPPMLYCHNLRPLRAVSSSRSRGVGLCLGTGVVGEPYGRACCLRELPGHYVCAMFSGAAHRVIISWLPPARWTCWRTISPSCPAIPLSGESLSEQTVRELHELTRR
jgi:hypothetical protein